MCITTVKKKEVSSSLKTPLAFFLFMVFFLQVNITYYLFFFVAKSINY
jgi:hypothetical protein